MEAISGRKTIQEIAADLAVHPIQVSQWKRQLLDGSSELFTRGKKAKDKEGQAKEAEMFQQNGRLQMELEWLTKSIICSKGLLKKILGASAPDAPVYCALIRPAGTVTSIRPTFKKLAYKRSQVP